MTRVVKFGGSSLANGPQYEKVTQIIMANHERRIVVVSAPGKRDENDQKVTDLLIEYATLSELDQNIENIQKTLVARYETIAQYFQLSPSDFKTIRETIIQLPLLFSGKGNDRLAYFKAHGEKLNAMLMALILQKLGQRARFVDPAELGLVVTGQPDSATITEESYTNIKHFKISDDEILVIPGFYGVTKKGDIATFARGGSDITGSIVARGFGVHLYENFTDVSSVYAANPNIVDRPVAIEQMTYREMRELSYAGFSVFNDEAIIPAIQGQVTINVKNTNRPNDPGTRIIPEHDFHPSHPITGVSNSDHFSALYLHRYLLNQEVGLTLKLLQIFYRYNISYEHMPSGIDDLTIIFDNRQLTEDKIQALCADIEETLEPDAMQWIEDYTIIMIVGEGMFLKPTTVAEAISSLTMNGIEVNMINQGASQISAMIGTKKKDAKRAVATIYQHFFQEDNHD
ncbi:aspartate kinase [Fructobacillus fructosus]|uniref:aspartate kinase n=1 Tax=Fructobacillus fructosus TaxID=1631 RepID=UPI001658A94B|nr:aspartate kinase [Fructobacillus fructosus]MBC9118810.1 aspartate kinase [Fructobacillus fructosus]MBD9365474.1 aspartate kinase [Leuconostoc mesenteroides]CAK1236530.1 Aspartate kinase (MetL1) [Fructobacillus fructosus]